MNKKNIDFIIYWVDGNDKKWQEKRNLYSPTKTQDAGVNRYRDWENLKYLFRGIEKFAPWVHKVYFVSDNQIPEWLNVQCPKLKIIDHKDYMPQEYLPTFNSRPIELNFHRIRGLSEQFVVFNDDFFITNYVKPTDFFVNGKPKDILMEYPVMCGGNTITFSNVLVNEFNMLGKYFNRKEYRKKLRKKILSVKYGKYFFYNMLLYMLPYPRFFGLLTPHFARPYLKSSFKELWELEGSALDELCRNKFKSRDDMNIYIFRIWNILKGNFIPANVFKMGKAFMINKEDPTLYKTIEQQKYKLICINDDCPDQYFERIKNRIIVSFEKILPEKCSFEREGCQT